MNDLMEMELNGFNGAWPMARRLGTQKLRARAAAPKRAPATRSAAARKAGSPKTAIAHSIVHAQLARTLAPALSGVLDAAVRRKLAVSHGEQIEIPDLGKLFKDLKARAYLMIASPVAAAVTKAVTTNPTTLSAALIKGVVTFALEKAKEAGLLNATESEVIKQIAPKAIEKALPAIIEQVGKLGDGEAEGEGDLLAELESRW